MSLKLNLFSLFTLYYNSEHTNFMIMTFGMNGIVSEGSCVPCCYMLLEGIMLLM